MYLFIYYKIEKYIKESKEIIKNNWEIERKSGLQSVSYIPFSPFEVLLYLYVYKYIIRYKQ